MKLFITILLFAFSISTTNAQDKKPLNNEINPSKKLLIVEASCGECKLGLKGKDCDLAVRLNGKSYFVDGANIDSHGDAHAKNGFCNAIRKAEVQGEIVSGRFKASYFKVVDGEVRADSSLIKQQ